MELKDKVCLTIEEAAEYSNIGQSKLYDVIKRPMCSFVLKVGNKNLIKRKSFERWLENQTEI